MKILITGASGFLGTKLFDILSRNHEIAGTYFTKKKNNLHAFLDITSEIGVEKFISQVNPDAVIHTAALVNVDFCEVERDKAYKINVLGTQNVIKASKRINAKLIYISSDYVFDGENPPYRENDKCRPVNYYGETKLEGEEIVQKELDDFLIIRPTILYGFADEQDKTTYVTQVLEKLALAQPFGADTETVKYPILIDDVALAIKKLLELDEQGIYHVATQTPMTRYEWSQKIAEEYGYSKDIIRKEIARPKAKKPRNVLLDTSKIERLGITFVEVEEGLKMMSRQKGCMFRMIYSLRPDMLLLNQNASEFRIAVGKQIAKEHPAAADIVVPIPESGIYGATGFADEAKIPLYFGLIRDYYTPKTLFEPSQEMRNVSLRKKLIVVPNVVRNKRLILIDEAILSGATLAVAVDKIKSAGVKEIHVRIPAPPMISQCTGRVLDAPIHLPAQEFCKGDNLEQDKGKIEEGFKSYFNVDSLRFLSLDSFLDCIISKSDVCVDCFKYGD